MVGVFGQVVDSGTDQLDRNQKAQTVYRAKPDGLTNAAAGPRPTGGSSSEAMRGAGRLVAPT